jgi:hypothetical protein
MKVIESKPIIETFKLDSDPDDEATVSFRQATWDETRARETFINRQYAKNNFNILDLMTYEIYMTLTEANGILDEKGKPFFKFKDDGNGLKKVDGTREEFAALLGKLPPPAVYEMRECLLKVNPHFAPGRAKEPEAIAETGE